MRNVWVQNLTFERTTCGIRLKAWRDRGGLVEGLHYEHLSMTDVDYPIFISSYYPREPSGPAEDFPANGNTRIPVWRDISIKDISATGAKIAMILWGLPDQPISQVNCDNVHISAERGAMVFHANDIKFFSSNIVATSGPSLQLSDATVTGIKAVPFTGPAEISR